MAQLLVKGPWRYPFALPKSAMNAADRAQMEWAWAKLQQSFDNCGFTLYADGRVKNQEGVEPQTSALQAEPL